MRMIAARFVGDGDCRAEIGRDQIGTENDTVVSVQTVVTKIRHVCSLGFVAGLQT